MPAKLLLWDIDGTLIDSGGAGGRGLFDSLTSEFGITDPLDWLDYYGRTDVWIARRILQHHGLSAGPQEVLQFLEGYLRSLARGMHNPQARLLPGIQEIVTTLGRRTGYVQGLLTGNLRRGAEIKLGHFNFLSPFGFGAYADDAEHRNDLGPVALKRAKAYTGLSFAPSAVYVLGDTPHDIACGRAIGARTVALATGKHSLSELATHQPDLLFEDLSDVSDFLRQIDHLA